MRDNDVAPPPVRFLASAGLHGEGRLVSFGGRGHVTLYLAEREPGSVFLGLLPMPTAAELPLEVAARPEAWARFLEGDLRLPADLVSHLASAHPAPRLLVAGRPFAAEVPADAAEPLGGVGVRGRPVVAAVLSPGASEARWCQPYSASRGPGSIFPDAASSGWDPDPASPRLTAAEAAARLGSAPVFGAGQNGGRPP